MAKVVLDKDLSAPPGSPNYGDSYLIGGSATGDWSGHDYEITDYTTTGWVFFTPKSGFEVWVNDEKKRYIQTNSSAPWSWSPYDFISAVEYEFTCTATEQVRDAVYISAADNVRQADATDANKMPVFGFIIFKHSSTRCIVVRTGELTGFTSLTSGAHYYANPSTPGGITATLPTTPNKIQIMGHAKNTTTLLIAMSPLLASASGTEGVEFDLEGDPYIFKP